MPQDIYDFDETFQTVVLSLLKDGLLPPQHVQPTYFDNPVLSGLCTITTKLLSRSITPTKAVLLQEAKRHFNGTFRDYQDDLKSVIARMFEAIPSSDQDYVRSLALDFAKYQRYRQTLLKSVEALRNGGVDVADNIERLWVEALRYEQPDETPGLWYFEDLPQRLRRRQEQFDVLQSLIPELDFCLEGGGFVRGDLTVFLGLTSVGKSFALLHMAKVAVFQRKRVLYLSLEMSEDQNALRLDAAISGLQTREVRSNSGEVLRLVQKSASMFGVGNDLLIKALPAGKARLSTIRSQILLLKQQGWMPEVLCLDYINLVRPEVRGEARHSDLGGIYMDLKGLGRELDLWLFTAAQSNRTGYTVDTLTVESIAESYEGAMHSDIVLTLNATEEERKRQAMRLFIAKNRNEISHRMIRGYSDYSRGIFWARSNDGVARPTPLQQRKKG